MYILYYILAYYGRSASSTLSRPRLALFERFEIIEVTFITFIIQLLLNFTDGKTILSRSLR